MLIHKTRIPACLDGLDNALHAHCSKVQKDGELWALSGWVNSACLGDVNKELAKYIHPDNEIRFRLAWIDRSPIVRCVPSGLPIPEDGEIADVVIIRLHVFKQTLASTGYMFFVQAKADDNLPYIPSQSSSGRTQREFKFMRSWPPFTLDAWSRSTRSAIQYDVMNGINNPQAMMREMSWFAVAPYSPKAKTDWALPQYSSSPWWAGPPEPGRACNVALSKVLLKMALRSGNLDQTDKDGHIGRGFQFSRPATAPGVGRTWDDLAEDIIAIATSNGPATQQIDPSRVIGFLRADSNLDFRLPDLNNSDSEGSSARLPVIFIAHFE